MVDVSDPAAPEETLFYDALKSGNGIAAAGDCVYVADGAAGLVILLNHLAHRP